MVGWLSAWPNAIKNRPATRASFSLVDMANKVQWCMRRVYAQFQLSIPLGGAESHTHGDWAASPPRDRCIKHRTCAQLLRCGTPGVSPTNWMWQNHVLHMHLLLGW
jgi:hypothetical protein